MWFNPFPLLNNIFASTAHKNNQSTASSPSRKQSSTATNTKSATSNQPTWLNEPRPQTTKRARWADDGQQWQPQPARLFPKSTPSSFMSTETASGSFWHNPAKNTMKNIAAPLVSLFSGQNPNQPPATTTNTASSPQSPQSQTPEVDMLDATLQTPEVEMLDSTPQSLPTPPSTPPHETLNNGDGSFVGDMKSALDSDSSTPHPTLRPVPHAKRRIPILHKRDFAADVTMEEDDGTLPEGYVGTHENIHFYIPKVDDSVPCGTHGYHELACGHWIMDTSKIDEPGLPCGLNCTKPSVDAEAFKCPQCHQIVMDILNNDLTDMEKQKLEGARNGGHDMFMISFITEFVTKRGKLASNVTETVMAIVKDDYGRSCSAAQPPEPIKYMTPAEMLEAVQNSRDRKEFAKNNKLNTHDKRGAGDITDARKRQKTKLETHKEPITTKTRGLKRSPTIHNVFNRKRVAVAPPVQYGKASFLTPPRNVVGPLVRKHELSTAINKEITERRAKKHRIERGGMRAEDDIARWDPRVWT